MSDIPYYLVEAFGSKPFTGNPAAVCLPNTKLSHTVMQKIATQFNLSETAFVFPKEDGFEIRWFTPLCEVSLCGHATLAAACALWESGEKNSRFSFHSKTAELSVDKTPQGITLNFPRFEAQVLSHQEITKNKLPLAHLFPDATSFSLSLKSFVVEFSDASEVISFEPEIELFKQLPFSGIFITAKSEDSNFDFISRCFFPSEGIPEDPVTGSAHCTLGPYWAAKLGKSELKAFQASARSGELGIKVLSNAVELTGKTRLFASGKLHLDNFLK